METEFNNYPAWMKKPFDKTIIYTFNDIKQDPDNPGRYLIPFIYQFKLSDYIVVTDEDGTNSRPIHIGYINKTNSDGTIMFGQDLFFSKENFGRIVLDPKRASDHAKFMFMEYSNMNANNPNRDVKTAPVWKREDLQVEAKNNRVDRKARKEAMLEAIQLSSYTVDILIDILGSQEDKNKSEEEKRDVVEDIAENDPTVFMSALKSSLSEIISIAKTAKESDILRNDLKKGAFVWSNDDSVIFSTKGVDRKKTYQVFAKFLQENPKVLTTIKSRISALELV
tara:strand:+ start:625 stop:1467 length:843 start_codon:yes stop_codon:yes gene_type:complete